jgi:hypothetical protein
MLAAGTGGSFTGSAGMRFFDLAMRFVEPVAPV